MVAVIVRTALMTGTMKHWLKMIKPWANGDDDDYAMMMTMLMTATCHGEFAQENGYGQQ